jgi:hypothetical protein
MPKPKKSTPKKSTPKKSTPKKPTKKLSKKRKAQQAAEIALASEQAAEAIGDEASSEADDIVNDAPAWKKEVATNHCFKLENMVPNQPIVHSFDSDTDITAHPFLINKDNNFLLAKYSSTNRMTIALAPEDVEQFKTASKADSSAYPPDAHDLLKDGILYRGLPLSIKEAQTAHITFETDAIELWRKIGFEEYNHVTCDRSSFPLSADIDNTDKHTFMEITTEMQDSETVRIVFAKWPMAKAIPTFLLNEKTETTNGYKAWLASDSSNAMKGICLPCPRDNGKIADSTGKKFSKGLCKCGAVIAAIVKGVHEEHENPHLRPEAFLKFAPQLDAFRTVLLEYSSGTNAKRVLCFFLRLFVPTDTDSKDQSKYALIGTDQRSTTNFGSRGCQIGIPALCLNFLAVIFGKWTNWPSLSADSWDIQQQLPDDKKLNETVFRPFATDCLIQLAPKDLQTEPTITAHGKLKLTIWMNGNKNDKEKKKTGNKDATEASNPIGGFNRDERGYKSVWRKNLLFELLIRCLVKYENVTVFDGQPVTTLHPHLLFTHWHLGEVMPITKSINKQYSTFYMELGCVRAILGETSKTPSIKQLGKVAMKAFTGVTTTVACYAFKYLQGNRTTNILMETKGRKIPYQRSPSPVATSPDNMDDPLFDANLFHASNVTVHQLHVSWSTLLRLVTDAAIGPIPKRSGQTFGENGPVLSSLTPATHTLLSVNVAGDGTEQAGKKPDIENTGLFKLLKHAINLTDEQKAILMEMQMTLRKDFMTELQWTEDDQDIDTVFSVDYRHSRFDTNLVVRPLPFLDTSLEHIQAMQVNEDTFVKDYVVPGPEGVWIRLFVDGTDIKGRLIKIEPDTILGIPFTVIKEVGRISHIEGNPHFVIRIILTKTRPANQPANQATQLLGTKLVRCYPHMLETVKTLMAKKPQEWEDDMNTVMFAKLANNKVIFQLAKKEKEQIGTEKLWSNECATFDDHFEV